MEFTNKLKKFLAEYEQYEAEILKPSHFHLTQAINLNKSIPFILASRIS